MYECELVERTSRKTGKTFMALEITFPQGYKKLVFLTPAELALALISK